MPLGKTIEIIPEELPYYDSKLSKLPVEKLDSIHTNRLSSAPGFEAGKPLRWWDFEQITWNQELESIWGKSWGAQGIGQLKEILLCAPSENETRDIFYKEPITYWVPNRNIQVRKPNLNRWLEQYQGLVDAYSGEGVVVNQLKVPNVPLMGPYGYVRWFVNIADILVINSGAIMSRDSKHMNARGRGPVWRKALDALGVPIIYGIHGKGIGDPGGCVWLDNNHLVTVEGIVMNRDAINQLKPILTLNGIKLLISQAPTYLDKVEWPAGGTSHADMFLGIPDAGVAIVYPPMCSYSLLRLLKRMKFDIIEASTRDYLTSGCNFVTIKPGKIISAAGGDHAIKEMEKRGIDVISVPYDEPASGGAGGTMDCITCDLRRDEGPSNEELARNPVEEVAPELLV